VFVNEDFRSSYLGKKETPNLGMGIAEPPADRGGRRGGSHPLLNWGKKGGTLVEKEASWGGHRNFLTPKR